MFGRKMKLFRLLGFEVGVDPSWIVLAILVAWSLSTGYFPYYYRELSGSAYWTMGIVGAAGLFLSIIFHEFSHSLVARRNGMPMKGITLFIFGGVAEMGQEPPGAKQELQMAAAGPVASFVMAAVFTGIRNLSHTADWPLAITAVFGYLGMINFWLALFNLVPAFPLDGGRILRSILWGWKKDLRWATRVSSSIGAGFGVVLILLGLLRLLAGNFIGGMWLSLIGMFIHNAAKMSYQQLLTRRALEGEPVSRFMNADPVTVSPDIALDDFVENVIYRHHFKLYPVQDGDRLVGCVTNRKVKEVPRERWAQTTVGAVADPCSEENTVAPDTDAVHALSTMRQNGVSRMMVVDGDRLAGIIALKDLLDFLSLKIEFDDS